MAWTAIRTITIPTVTTQTNFPMFFGGSGTVNTSGTAVTWVSGTQFASYMVGEGILINSVVYTVASYTSATSITLSATAGTQSGVAWNPTPYLRTIANGGNVTSSSGYDICFFSDAGLTTKLNFGKKRYVATTGEVAFWIKIPTLSTGSVIYMAYGDSGVTFSLENQLGIFDSNYKIVAPLGDGTTLSVSDWTLTSPMTNTGATVGTGKVGGGASFNGTSNYVSSTDLFYSDVLTVSAWVKPTTDANPRNIILKRNTSGATQGSAEWALLYSSSIFQFTVYNGATAYNMNSTTVPSSTSWSYVVGVANGAGNIGTIYINGVSEGTVTQSLAITDTSSIIQLGSTSANNASRYYSGTMDEARVSNIGRSDTWIATEYANQNSPSSWYTIGTAVSGVRSIQGISSMSGLLTI